MTIVLLMQLHQTSAKRRTSFLYSLICEPLIWLVGLGRWVEWTPAEEVVFRDTIGGRLKHIVSRMNLETDMGISYQDTRYIIRKLSYLRVQCRDHLLL